MSIHAVFENGVFRPIERVDIPDRSHVQIDVREITAESSTPSLDDVYAILARRHASGEHDLAERHNEHQP
jgi:predicted DNA-binding antitoxin AbrB/MazE fold protein